MFFIIFYIYYDHRADDLYDVCRFFLSNVVLAPNEPDQCDDK